MNAPLYTWGENHQQELQIAAAIIAAIVTYGAASEWVFNPSTLGTMGTFDVATGQVVTTATWGGGVLGGAVGTGAISATTASTIAGIAGGAASGAIAGGIMTGTVKGTLQGAAAGAIMGGVSGYYGNTWNLGRVGVTAVAGGAASTASGGSFGRGFEISGAIAFVTDIAYNMRMAQVENSKLDPRNASGKSVGFFGDAFKLGGGRFDERFGAIQDVSRLGGVQGGQGLIRLPLIGTIEYASGSALDRVVEAYAGVHDWLNSLWGYNPATGNYNPGLSLFGSHGSIRRDR